MHEREVEYARLIRKKDGLLNMLRDACEYKVDDEEDYESIERSFLFPEILANGIKLFEKKRRENRKSRHKQTWKLC